MKKSIISFSFLSISMRMSIVRKYYHYYDVYISNKVMNIVTHMCMHICIYIRKSFHYRQHA